MYTIIASVVLGVAITLYNVYTGNFDFMDNRYDVGFYYANVSLMGMLITMISAFGGWALSTYFASRISRITRTVSEARLIPLNESEGSCQSPVFVRLHDERNRQSFTVSVLNDDGTRELKTFYSGSALRVLEDPQCKESGIWRVTERPLSNESRLRRWAIDMNDYQYQELRVPVGTLQLHD